MGLLDQLWDDTVAGPPPENGLGKLRKHSTFNFRSTSGKDADGRNVRSLGDDPSEEVIRVTRSIMIVKPPGYQNASPPVSPSGSIPPVSPSFGLILVYAYVSKEAEMPIHFEEEGHQMDTRRQMKLDPGALLLLTTSDI